MMPAFIRKFKITRAIMPAAAILAFLLAAPFVAAAEVAGDAEAAGDAEVSGDAEAAAIEDAARDYILGFYGGDGERIARSVHPLLAKRTVEKWGDVEVLRPMTAEQLGAASVLFSMRNERGPEDVREIAVLDRTDRIATVKVDTSDFVDYVHLGKINGKWMVVNVLWEPNRAEARSGDDASAAGLPAAEDILEKHIEALGGRAAHDKLATRIITGAVVVPEQSIALDMKRFEADPASMYQELAMEGFGKTMRGTDGVTAWRIHPRGGASLILGSEKEFLLRQTRFNSALHWREFFSGARCAGIEEVGKRPCYRIVLATSGGDKETWFIDRETHLLARKEMTYRYDESEDMPIVELPSDYREVDGVLIPFKVVSIEGEQTFEVSFDSVVHNTEIPAERFAPPAEIRKLLEKKR
jgi:hypothetical protein